MVAAQIYSIILNPWSLISYFGSACSQETGVDCSDNGLPQTTAGSNQIQDVLKIAFAILAALAVLFIVVAGFRMVIAQGNPQEVGKAKGTIIYALVGLLVALLAEAIVSFVLGKL
jgi:hypothetical protein